MSPQPLDIADILSRFRVKTDTAVYNLCQQAFTLMRDGRPVEAVARARAAVRDGDQPDRRGDQAYAFAYLAAVYALQGNYIEAARLSEDSHRLFKQMSDAHNATVARALLAVVYQMQMETLSCELIDSLQDSRVETYEMEAKALSKGSVQVDLANRYHQQFVEFGDVIRRARWLPAVQHALPLIWLPVVNTISLDPTARDAEPEGYMEPVLFVLKTKQDVAQEELPTLDPGQIVDQLYTARPLPPFDDADLHRLRPPRLKPDAHYAAVKVDPDSARLAGLEPEDYLLVRRLTQGEKDNLMSRAGENIVGYYFQLDASGKVEVVRAIPPKFVGEEYIKMLVAQVDAVLRRVP